jgi:hypothetical protein
MTSATHSQQQIQPFPDHTQLPESDGTFVKNFQEHPQSLLLTDTIELPWLRWWDQQGNLLLTGHEKAAESQNQLEQERQKVERLAAQLRAAGIEPEV